MKKTIAILMIALLVILTSCSLNNNKYEIEVRDILNEYLNSLNKTLSVEYYLKNNLKQYQFDEDTALYLYTNEYNESLKEKYYYHEEKIYNEIYIFDGSNSWTLKEELVINEDNQGFRDNHQTFDFQQLDFNEAKYKYNLENRFSSQPNREILFHFDKKINFTFKYLDELVILNNIIVKVNLTNPEIDKELMVIELKGLDQDKKNIELIIYNVKIIN